MKIIFSYVLKIQIEKAFKVVKNRKLLKRLITDMNIK